MAFTRYANAEIVDVRSTPTRQRTASLDRFSDFHKYRTSDGYLYVRVRAISSRVNKNHDGWPSVELAGTPDLINQRRSNTGFTVEASEGPPDVGFATFVGKPLFVDHHNSNPKKARGVVVDAKLRVLDPKEAASDRYWNSDEVDPEHIPATEIELLAEVDAKAFPRLAKAIVNGDLDGVSMGCNVERTKCSHCGNMATTPDEFCSHVLMKGAHHDVKTADGKRISKKSYENCYGCGFFELSFVFDPADETALAREIRSAVEKEADLLTEHGVAPVDPIRSNEDAILDLAEKYVGMGVSLDAARDMAIRKLEPQGVHGENGNYGSPRPYTPQMIDYDFNTPIQRELSDMSQREFDSEGNAHYPHHNDSRWSHTKTAENPLPQEFLVRAPDEVDTLRDEKICPICGSDMKGETCDVCGFVQPPKDFDNPDLDKATEIRDQMKEQEEAQAPGGQESQGQGEPGGNIGEPSESSGGGPLTSQSPSKSPAIASLTNEMNWTPLVHPVTAARINQVEQPVTGSNKPTSNEPTQEVVIKDQHAPVTSAMVTAKQLIAQTKEQNMNRTADGPTPPGDTSSDARVDVEGVGGVMDGSNEAASSADAQVDVTGKGGTGVSDVSADSTQSLPTAGRESDDAGFNSDKTTEDSGPTKTYDKMDGTEDGARDPVTNESLESQPQQGGSEGPVRGNPSYSHERVAYDDKTLEQNDQQGDPIAQGGSATQGVPPIDPVATDSYKRVNVLEHKTSPSNNSGPTKTWTGTDGNGVLKQQPPVTNERLESQPQQGGSEGPVRAAKVHFTKAIRTAEAEEELGLISRGEKWDRVAKLDAFSDAELDATLASYAKVKTAGLQRLAMKRQAGVTKVPHLFGKQTAAPHGFERIASDEPQTKEASSDPTLDDSALFMK